MKFMKVTMSDLFLKSNGLELQEDDYINLVGEKIIRVQYGEISGEFIAYETDGKKLSFRTDNIVLALEYLDTRPNSAKIEYQNSCFIIEWERYNYTLSKIENKLVISLEELL